MVQFNFLYEGWRNELLRVKWVVDWLGAVLAWAGRVGDAAVLLPFGVVGVRRGFSWFVIYDLGLLGAPSIMPDGRSAFPSLLCKLATSLVDGV